MKEVIGLGKPETDRCVRSTLDHLAGANHGDLLSRGSAVSCPILRRLMRSDMTVRVSRID